MAGGAKDGDSGDASVELDLTCGQRLLSSPEMFDPPDLDPPSAGSDDDEPRVASPVPPPTSTAVRSGNTAASATLNSAASATGTVIRVRAPLDTQPSSLAQAWSFNEDRPRPPNADREARGAHGARDASRPSPLRQRAGNNRSRPAGGGSRRTGRIDTSIQPNETFGTEVLIPVGGNASPPRRRAFLPANQTTGAPSVTLGRARASTSSGAGGRPTAQRSVGSLVVQWSSTARLPTVPGSGNRNRRGGITVERVGSLVSKDALVSMNRTATVPGRATSLTPSRSTGNNRSRNLTRTFRIAPRPPGRGFRPQIAEVTSLASGEDVAGAATNASAPLGNSSAAARRTAAADAPDNDDADEITMVFDSSQKQVEVVDLDSSGDEIEVEDVTLPRDGSSSVTIRSSGQTTRPSSQTVRPSGQTAGPKGRTARHSDQTAGPSGQTARPSGHTRESSDQAEEANDQTVVTTAVWWPSVQTTGSSGETAGPSGQTAGSSGQSAGSSGDTAGPSGETAGPSGQSASSSDQRTGPSGQITGPSGQITWPSDETSIPCGQPAGPSDQTEESSGQTDRSGTGGSEGRPRSEQASASSSSGSALRAVRLNRKRPGASQPTTQAVTEVLTLTARGTGDSSAEEANRSSSVHRFMDALTLGAREALEGSASGGSRSPPLATQDVTASLTLARRQVLECSSGERTNLPPATQGVTDALTLAARESPGSSTDRGAVSPLPGSQDWEGADPEPPQSQRGDDSDVDDPGPCSPPASAGTVNAGNADQASADDRMLDADKLSAPSQDKETSNAEASTSPPREGVSNAENPDRVSSSGEVSSADNPTPAFPVSQEPEDADSPVPVSPYPASPTDEMMDAEDADESTFLPLRISCLYDGDTSVTADASFRPPTSSNRAETASRQSPRPPLPDVTANPETPGNEESSPVGAGGSMPGSAGLGDGSEGFDDDRPGSGESMFDLIETISQDSSELSGQSPFPDRMFSARCSPAGSEMRPSPVPKSSNLIEGTGSLPKSMEPCSLSSVERPVSPEKELTAKSTTTRVPGPVTSVESSASVDCVPESPEEEVGSSTSSKAPVSELVADHQSRPSEDVPVKPRSLTPSDRENNVDESDMFNDSLETYSLDTVVDRSASTSQHVSENEHKDLPQLDRGTEGYEDEEQRVPKNKSLSGGGCRAPTPMDVTPDTLALERVMSPALAELPDKTAPSMQTEVEPDRHAEADAKSEQVMEADTKPKKQVEVEEKSERQAEAEERPEQPEERPEQEAETEEMPEQQAEAESKLEQRAKAEERPTQQAETEETERPSEVGMEVIDSVNNALDEPGSTTGNMTPVEDEPFGKDAPRRTEPPSKDVSADAALDTSLLVSRAEFGEYLDKIESELAMVEEEEASRSGHRGSAEEQVGHCTPQTSTNSGKISSASLASETVIAMAKSTDMDAFAEERLADGEAKNAVLKDDSLLTSSDQSGVCSSGSMGPSAGQDFREPPLVSAAGMKPPASECRSGASVRPGQTDGGESDAAPVGQPEGNTHTADHRDRPDPGPDPEPPTTRTDTHGSRVHLLLPPPPSVDEVLASLLSEGLPTAPTRPILGAGRGDAPLPPFEGEFQSSGLHHWRAVAAAAGADVADVTALVSALEDGGGASVLASRRHCTLTPARPPPSRAAVVAWLTGRRHRRRPEPDSSGEDSDSDSENEEEERKDSGEERRTADGPNSASTPFTASAAPGRPPSAMSITPVRRESSVRRTAAYGTVTSVLTPVRIKPTKRRRLVPPLSGPTGRSQAVGSSSRLENLLEEEEGGERERTVSGETESEGVTGGESEEVAAVTGGVSSSQETRFSAASDGRDSGQGGFLTPQPPGRDLTSPLQPSVTRRDQPSPLAPAVSRDMTSPLEPSLLISPSFGLQRPNSSDNTFGFRMDSDNLQDAQCSHEVSFGPNGVQHRLAAATVFDFPFIHSFIHSFIY